MKIIVFRKMLVIRKQKLIFRQNLSSSKIKYYHWHFCELEKKS